MSTSSGSHDHGRFDELDEDAANGDSSPTPPISPRLRQIGDYRILREVGRGGMGVVYEAEQVSLGRRVALKVLPGHVAGDHKVLMRFRREAKAAAALHHTNIVPVFEVGHDGDIAFYAMQFIQGQGLDQIVDELRRRRGPDRQSAGEGLTAPACPDVPSTAKLAPVATASGLRKLQLRRVAASLLSGRLLTEGLEFPAGDASATIASVKTVQFDPDSTETYAPGATLCAPPSFPTASNLPDSGVPPGGMLGSEVESSGRRLPFFVSVAQIGRQAAQGLAHAHSRGIVHRDIKPSNLLLDTAGIVWITDFGLAKSEDDGLTATGDILGTLRYMAPERFRGGGDARADVYALGLTLYELLTLQPAFNAADRLKFIETIKSEEPARPRSLEHRIPRDLETIVLKAIEKDPDRRYPTARAMAEDLRRFLADEPILARRASAVERYWRWARRNPVIAVLGGVLTGVLVLATVGSLLAARSFHAQAETQHRLADARESERRLADRARAKEAAANARLLTTQEELRQTVYATRSNLALAAWDANDLGGLRSLIDLLRPSPGHPDLRGWEWRYLWQLVHQDRLTLRAQEDSFADVAFSPDGQILAGLERKGRIQLWGRSGQLLRTTGGTTRGIPASLASGVTNIAFSPDGRTIAGPGPDESLVLYAVATGLPTLRFAGSPGAVLGLAWSPDGHTLVAAVSAHVMRVWDARDGHLIHHVFGGHNGPVASVAFSPDGRTIASASFDHTVKLWAPDDPRNPRAVLEGHTDEVHAVAISPDGRRVASVSRDRTLRIWDALSGAALAVIRGHTGLVTSLAYLPDGERVVTGSADETVRVWDTASGEELRTFKGTDDFGAVAVSPDGREIAAAGAGALRLWDVASPPRPRTLQNPSVLKYGGNVECLAFSPDGRRLVSGHDDHALRVWELPSGQPLHVIKGHSLGIKCVVFSPDGHTIASGSRDRTVRLWDADTGKPRLTFSGHTDELRGLVFTPDGQTVLSSSHDRTIQAWDPATGIVRYVLRGHTDVVHDIALCPDGKTLASVSYDKTIILWDLPGRLPRITLRGHTDQVNTVAFSPDGKILATASDDKTVRLWGVSDGAPRGIFEGHIDEVSGLAFSPDGRLASSGSDKTIRLWDCASGQTLLVLKGHAGRIRCLKFSPDGRTLGSASYDRTLKLWEAAPAAALTVATEEPAASSHGDRSAQAPGGVIPDPR